MLDDNLRLDGEHNRLEASTSEFAEESNSQGNLSTGQFNAVIDEFIINQINIIPRKDFYTSHDFWNLFTHIRAICLDFESRLMHGVHLPRNSSSLDGSSSSELSEFPE